MGWREGMLRRSVIAALLLFSLTPLAEPSSLSREAPFVYRKQYAMGTVYEIVAYSPSFERASRAIDAAFSVIHSLDRMMSDYDPQSDLSLLDRRAQFHAVVVRPDLYRVIQASLVYSRLSHGKYDVTIGPLAAAWKSAMRGGHAPSAAQIERLRSCIGYRKVQLIPPDRVELHSSCMRLDLGSIAKGYAVDRAVKVLRSYGIHNAFISAGGSSIYGMGAPPGHPGWSVRLRDPSGRVQPEVILRDASVSTSEQFVTSLIDVGEFGHIIDPVTGRPLHRSFTTVSVVTRSAMAADGLSTTLFLMGPEAGGQLVRALPDTAAIWISPAGKAEMDSTGPHILLHHAQRRNLAGR